MREITIEPMPSDGFGPLRSRMKHLRRRRHYSQKTLAKLIGCPEAAVSHWETGFREPTVRSLCRIAGAFGVSLDYLMGLSDETRPARRG